MKKNTTYRWVKQVSYEEENNWRVILGFLDPQCLVVTQKPDSQRVTIAVYGDGQLTQKLVNCFGGRKEKLLPLKMAQASSKVISIRGKFKIFSQEKPWQQWGEKNPRGLYIPAGMAFGTGDHATTATCLRLLCDARLPAGFSACDVGCGSGILGIACEHLGATVVDAFDNDPAAVRITSENAVRNGCRVLHATQQDVFKWKPRKQYGVILANLFSEVLIAVAPRLVQALQPDGILIFSGVLQEQSAEVLNAFSTAGLECETLVPRGKWCAGVTVHHPSQPFFETLLVE